MTSSTVSELTPGEAPVDPLAEATRELRAAAEAKVAQFREAFASEDVKAATDRVVRETTHRLREVTDNASAFIRESPGKAALAALGVGFVIGLLFRRD